MPKERHHLLLAEECRKRLQAAGVLPPLDLESRFAYLLGSISPDIFFYDVPTFALARFGSDLHRYEGEAGLVVFKDWLEEESRILPLDMKAWILGAASHFLADAFWHPAIQKSATEGLGLCRTRGFSARDCHHWIESELEAFWITAIGPTDAYQSFIRQVRQDRGATARIARFMRRFLLRSALPNVPDEARIHRCFRWQAALLEQFMHSAWRRSREWLLSRKWTLYWGALIVPLLPKLPEIQGEGSLPAPLCSGTFMARAVSDLSSRLALLAPLYGSHPVSSDV